MVKKKNIFHDPILFAYLPELWLEYAIIYLIQ